MRPPRTLREIDDAHGLWMALALNSEDVPRELITRTHHALLRSGVTSTADLMGGDPDDLCALPGVGSLGRAVILAAISGRSYDPEEGV